MNGALWFAGGSMAGGGLALHGLSLHLKALLAINTFPASLCQLSSNAMRDGRQVSLFSLPWEVTPC